jgi:hypothetical protein
MEETTNINGIVHTIIIEAEGNGLSFKLEKAGESHPLYVEHELATWQVCNKLRALNFSDKRISEIEANLSDSISDN